MHCYCALAHMHEKHIVAFVKILWLIVYHELNINNKF